MTNEINQTCPGWLPYFSENAWIFCMFIIIALNFRYDFLELLRQLSRERILCFTRRLLSYVKETS